MAQRYRVLETADGSVGFVVSEVGLARVFLPEANATALRAAMRRACPAAVEDAALLPAFAAALQRYFAGETVEFSVAFDERGYGEFERRIWRACAAIPYGETRSYKDLAIAVGNPAAARAVGAAMGHNPWPVVVPCHRVLKSDGSLGGYSGRLGVSFKRRLLDMEAAATGTSVT